MTESIDVREVLGIAAIEKERELTDQEIQSLLMLFMPQKACEEREDRFLEGLANLKESNFQINNTLKEIHREQMEQMKSIKDHQDDQERRLIMLETCEKIADKRINRKIMWVGIAVSIVAILSSQINNVVKLIK